MVNGIIAVVLGYLLGSIPTAYIATRLYKGEDVRRLGIGEQVLRQVIEQVKFKGARWITLEVRPSNAAALKLYKKLGFKMMGIRKGYYSNPPEDAFVLALHL